MQPLAEKEREQLRTQPFTYFNSWWNVGREVLDGARDHLAILPGCLANFAQVCEVRGRDEGEVRGGARREEDGKDVCHFYHG